MNFNEIMYPQDGMPFELRANMGGTAGKFFEWGENAVGDELTITPVAYRYFRAPLFQKKADRETGKDGTKNWVELFFPYEFKGKTVLAVLLYHGYSVENFIKTMQPFRYETTDDGNPVSIKDLEIRCGFEPHTNAAGDKYYIGSFRMKMADQELVKAGQEFADSANIYRADTIGADQTTLSMEGMPEEKFFVESGLLRTIAVKAVEIEDKEEAAA